MTALADSLIAIGERRKISDKGKIGIRAMIVERLLEFNERIERELNG